VKKWIILFLVLVLGMPVQAKEEPTELYAQSAVLMDADSGRVLFEKNGMDVKAMASTTKIMTCILALERGAEDEIATFSENAAKQPKVHLGAGSGEQFYLRDLLYSLMLESHNDSAVAIAETVAGDVKIFASMMNQKAKEIGCEHTYFITPNGLDASDEIGFHSTTAVDLARIMSYCIKKSSQRERFLEITSTAQHNFTNVKGNRTYSCSNHNLFLNMMEEAISGKTGFTADAGYCYVGAVESNGRTFVVSLLACGWPNNKNYKWADMKKLVSYGIDNYEYKTLPEVSGLEKIKVLDGIPVSEKLFEDTWVSPLVQTEEKHHILMHKNEEAEVQIEQEKVLQAPVGSGEQVGQVTYYLGGEMVAQYPIVTESSVMQKDFTWYFLKIIELYAVH